MSSNLEKLRGLLAELFQLDQADLDFGIYRIMNQKREEIVGFLDKDLLPQVQQAFQHYKSADKSVLQGDLETIVGSVRAAGMNPDDSPKVRELRQRIAESAVDVTALENEVFSHLTSFFRRYYSEGDFISLRRYKEGVYAIPYEGEEVKLHWANADQYYVKTSENFRDYTFKVSVANDGGAGERRVHFKLVEASTEQNNNKPANGKDRRFILVEDEPLVIDNDELVIRFYYRPDDEGRKQADLNGAAVARIVNAKGFDPWTLALARPAPTERNPNRTLLEKHLSQYTARNTFDYFIHKDLGGFLRRELDFYIKNEVMHLDDIEHASAPKVEQYLSQIKVIRAIAHKIIAFLEQLENFQKKLWLKKKFIIETNYCITLDRVPEELYPEIAANDAQREEWVRLFAIDEIKKDLHSPGYATPLTVEFLKANPRLIIDTCHFAETFVSRLVATIDRLDESRNGLLVWAENFQALRLMSSCLRGRVRFAYIDPPYNTGGDGFMFKDSYQHSTWISMISERLGEAHRLLADKSLLYCSIDAVERSNLDFVLSHVFGRDNRVEEVIWVQNSNKNQSPTFSTVHEYVPVYAKDIALVKTDFRMLREPKPGFAEVQALIESFDAQYPRTAEIEESLKRLYREHKQELKIATENGSEADDEWKGLYNYCHAEYRDANGNYVAEAEASTRGAMIWVWREGDSSMPQVKEDSQKAEFRDPEDPTFRFYKPVHPRTLRPCPHPKTGWRWPERRHGRQSTSFTELAADERIVWGGDETKVPQVKKFLHEAETNVAKSVTLDFTDGEKELTNLFGRSRSFSNPKPTTLVERFCQQAACEQELSLDFFAGSGTTAHAIITLNRKDNGNRRYVIVEVAEHFNSVLKPRIVKSVYANKWAEGKPSNRETSLSQCIKYIRLESYEDALNNLGMKRTSEQQTLLDNDSHTREQYLLSYMLDVETRGSQSLLNIDGFRHPDRYKLRVERNGETQLVNVDLVETFNWLLGLTVKHIDVIRGVRVVEGTNPDAERVLVLWRDLDELDNDRLDEWFTKQGYSTRDLEYDLVYVNGDNNLENLRRPDQTWKVRLIEAEFQRLMFDVEDV